MATPTIGALSFIRVSGRVAVKGYSLKDISRPGVDGHSFLRYGQRAPESQVETLCDFTTAALAAAHINACAALKGTLVTVAYSDGVSISNVAVLEVRPVGDVMYVRTPVGGVNGGAYLVRMAWMMQGT